MANSNATKVSTDATSLIPEQPRMRIFDTVSAMTLMWEKSQEHMTAQELEWFADGAAQKVNNDIRALSDLLEKTACVVSRDRTGHFQSAEGAANLLFSLHNQLDGIAGMAEVSEQANWLVRRALKVADTLPGALRVVNG